MLAHRLLNEIPGVTSVKPQGALYCFPRLDPEVYADRRRREVRHRAAAGQEDPGHPRHRLQLAEPRPLPAGHAAGRGGARGGDRPDRRVPGHPSLSPATAPRLGRAVRSIRSRDARPDLPARSSPRAKTGFRLLGQRFDMQGTEHIPRTGGVLLAVNHVSYVDFIYGGLAANPSGRLVRFMAKRELFDHKVVGPGHALDAPHQCRPGRRSGVVPDGRGVPPRRRGGRHLPRGHDLAGDGAQGVQVRSGAARRRGRGAARPGRPLGHAADDDQGPPPRLLARQDAS